MIVAFDPAHCEGAVAHPSQSRHQHMMDDPATFRYAWPSTFSAIDEGELIAIGGAVAVEGAQGGWVLFTDKVNPKSFMAVHKAVARVITGMGAVLAHIDPENPQAMRWAKLLGLRIRGTETMPDGRKMMRAEADERNS